MFLNENNILGINLLLINKFKHLMKYSIQLVKHIKVLTGFDIIPTRAWGLTCPITLIISHTIEIFVLNKSSRVIPGLRGIPAGIITTSVSATAS